MMTDKFRKTRLSLLLSLAILLLIAGELFAADFYIFHTSDVHGAISKTLAKQGNTNERLLQGGYAILQNLVDKYRQDLTKNGARFLYFDCGDFFQGTPIVDKTRGGVMIDMLNRIGVDAVTLGNHEFDYSYDNLVTQMTKRNFRVLCCNVYDKFTGRPLSFTENYAVYTHEGMRIGVVGINTPTTATISFEKNVKDVIFKDPLPIVQDNINKLKRHGVDFIILLSHLGLDEDLVIADQLEGLDLILGGHSHILRKEFEYSPKKRVPIIHSGSSFKNAGVIHINLQKGRFPYVAATSVPLLFDEIGENIDLQRVADSYLKELEAEMSKVIATSKVNLYRGILSGNSDAGYIMAEAMRERANGDIAFANYGGVRQSLFKGNITVENVFVVQPFDNAIETLYMQGKDILDTIERSLSNPTKTLSREDKETALSTYNLLVDGTALVAGGDYGFLIPAGLYIEFDLHLPPMSRVLKVTMDDKTPLRMDKTYKVVFNDFVASGGDGFSNLKNYKRHEKTDIKVRDAMLWYLEKQKTIDTKPEPRINNIRLSEKTLE